MSRITWDRCLCGRTHPRVRRIAGRSDGALSIGGFLVYPSRIQDVIHQMPELGAFHIILDSIRGLDQLFIKVEVRDGARTPSSELTYRLTNAIRSYLTVTPIVEMMPHGTLSMKEGTSYRVLDYRKGSGHYGAAD
jgi:phenylacetate-CoA ligase